MTFLPRFTLPGSTHPFPVVRVVTTAPTTVRARLPLLRTAAPLPPLRIRLRLVTTPVYSCSAATAFYACFTLVYLPFMPLPRTVVADRYLHAHATTRTYFCCEHRLLVCLPFTCAAHAAFTDTSTPCFPHYLFLHPTFFVVPHAPGWLPRCATPLPYMHAVPRLCRFCLQVTRNCTSLVRVPTRTCQLLPL